MVDSMTMREVGSTTMRLNGVHVSYSERSTSTAQHNTTLYIQQSNPTQSTQQSNAKHITGPCHVIARRPMLAWCLGPGAPSTGNAGSLRR
jgi:hypothetical protein